MKNTNKKGFTIIELVIVIAVIAILAAVLIPTFSGIIEKANKSAAEQAARNAYTQYVAVNADTGNFISKVCIKSDKYYVFVENSKVVSSDTTQPTGYALGVRINADGTVVNKPAADAAADVKAAYDNAYACAEITDNALNFDPPAQGGDQQG